MKATNEETKRASGNLTVCHISTALCCHL